MTRKVHEACKARVQPGEWYTVPQVQKIIAGDNATAATTQLPVFAAADEPMEPLPPMNRPHANMQLGPRRESIAPKVHIHARGRCSPEVCCSSMLEACET